MQQQMLTIYGATWCGDCRRAKRLLDERKVAYTWVDVERDPEGMAVVMQVNRGMQSIPTIIFPDGSTLVEPSNAALAQKLGI
ncbi:NrdH-redoxin [Chloroflexales bacterium ZM16-3]|nr:NrdH-redoxin [Chloroflexales bacterium ZM16-3]